LFALASGGIPYLIHYQHGEGHALQAIIKRDVCNAKLLSGRIGPGLWHDAITPYGYGGFIGNAVDWKAVQKECASYYADEHILCEFVRFSLFSNYYQDYEGIVETHSDNIVRLLYSSIDDILHQYEYKVRKNIKTAEKSSLWFLEDTEFKYKSEFMRIYYETMRRTSADDSFFFPESFFTELCSMQCNVALFFTMIDDIPISTEFVLYDNETAYSFLGGTDADYFSLRPNDFLKHGIIKWAKALGLKRFVLGGGYGSNDGIYKYKKSFAPTGVIPFYVGKKIINQTGYIKLCNIAGTNYNGRFFPAYRT
jgi:hypothetical protein